VDRVYEVFLYNTSTHHRMFSQLSFPNNLCPDLRPREMITSLIPCWKGPYLVKGWQETASSFTSLTEILSRMNHPISKQTKGWKANVRFLPL